MQCVACRAFRELGDLIAFWPVGDPDRRRFVCRPTTPSAAAMLPCFARAVGFASEHAISLATTPARVLEAPTPIRPDSEAWIHLLRSAGVRAA